jgi:hypothetical protein
MRSRLLWLSAPLLLVLASACAASAPVLAPTPAPTSSPALPVGDDLTLAEPAGTVLLGLSVRPARPGPNTLLIYVLPLDGPAAAASVPLTLAVDGQSVDLDTCSRTCRSANLRLHGGEHVDLTADGPGGGTARFDLPALPAADGTALLDQVQARMHTLAGYRIDETLGPAEPPLRAAYTAEAPDRLRIDFADGTSSIWIGATRYRRAAGTAGAWQAEPTGTSLPIPSFAWDLPAPGSVYTGVHVIGTETVDGVSTQVLAFFWRAGQTVAWFRLWADASGLVHQASMRAQGHFMDHHYTAFNAPPHITPPPPS